jgi:hypothetical protein
MNLAELWQVQRLQQELWHDFAGLSAAERDALAKDLLLHVHEEVGALQRVIDRSRYHLIKRSNDAPRASIAERGVDVFKLLIALMILSDISPEQFVEEFLRKTEVVKRKWEWERDQLAGVEVLLCDIDGCVAKWHEAFIGFALDHDVVVQPGRLNAPELEWLKDKFHEHGGFRRLGVFDGAVDTLNAWREHEQDHPRRLILVTARPFRRHRRIYTDTLWWCEAVGLKQDHILFEHDKAEAVRSVQPAKVIAHIEDRGKHALEVAATGVRVLKLPFEAAEEQIAHPNIIQVAGWPEIAAHLTDPGKD